MKRINLPLVLDTLLLGLCAFFLFFTAIRFYTKNVAIALCFGILACLLSGALAYLAIGRRQNAKLLISRDEKNKELLSLHLSLSSDEYVRNLLKNCIGEGAKISGNRVLCGGNVYFYDFQMHPLTEDDVAKIIKRKGENKILYCTALSPKAAYLAENFAIETRTIDRVYAELKEKELLPEKYVFEGAPKAGLWKRIKTRFTKKLCAPLFWSGISLLALSYFTFFPIYYIISGSIMLLLAAAALILNLGR